MPANPVLNDQRFEKVIADGYGTGVEDRRTMTLGGTMTALGVIFSLLIAAAVFGWTRVQQTLGPVLTSDGQPVMDEAGRQVYQNTTSIPGWIIIPLLAALAFAFATIFKPKLGMVFAPLYALCEGVVLGAISAVYNASWDGIVMQAVLATLSVVAVMFVLWVTRVIRVTQKYVMITLAATLGIGVMYLATWVLSIFGADITFWRQPSLLGIGISVVIVIVAAMNLAIDFEFIDKSVKSGTAPRSMEWYAAFGVTVTIVWLYLEILRLLALLRSR
ncbi:MAG: Bax inhibitor-1/YccA family protein [Acidimicrobiia bacterium]